MSLKYVFTLSEEAKKFAEDTLGERDETRDVAIEEIRKWLDENPKLNARRDDRSILMFLRGCKFNIQRTKEKLTNFYTIRTQRPEWFSDRDPTSPMTKELIKLGVFVPLKKLIDNRLVVIIRTSAHDPKRHPFNEVLKAGKMVLDVAAMECENASVFGVTTIFDMNNVSIGHARQLNPTLIKNTVFVWQNYHCRPKQLEFINAPLYINVVLNIFKSFMSEKLKNRVRVHFSGLNSLHQVVDKENLPPQYGGSGEDMGELINYWLNKLIEYSDWFREDEKYKADLSQ